jgi:hypothetical protein
VIRLHTGTFKSVPDVGHFSSVSVLCIFKFLFQVCNLGVLLTAQGSHRFFQFNNLLDLQVEFRLVLFVFQQQFVQFLLELTLLAQITTLPVNGR